MSWKSLAYGLLAGRHYRHARREMQRLEKRLVSARARFAVPFVFHGRGHFKSIEPRQNQEEIGRLYDLVCALRPAAVLEIGTARGGTLYLWALAAAPGATILSIDLPGGSFGGAYPACRAPFYRGFAGPSQSIHLLREDSHRAATVERVKRLLAGGGLEFLFIDGDHTYEGVRADFVNYAPLVKAGGMIAFHDILPRSDMPEIQVHRFWAEIKKVYGGEELLGPEGSKRRVGIGVLRIAHPLEKPALSGAGAS